MAGPAPPPQLSLADEGALSGFAGGLESLTLVGLEPQLLSAVVRPWERVLAEAADSDAGASTGLAPLRHLAIRRCGAIGAASAAALGELATLEAADFSGGAGPAASDVERLVRANAGLLELRAAPLVAGPAVLRALERGCPWLARLSVGGLRLGAAANVDAATMAAAAAAAPEGVHPDIVLTPRLGTLAGYAAEAAEAEEAEDDDDIVLLSVTHLSLISEPPSAPLPPPPAGAAAPAAAAVVQQLSASLGFGALVARTFPCLEAVEVEGAWDVSAAAVVSLCELLRRSGRGARGLRRLRLAGTQARPLPARLLAPLLTAPAPALEALALECLEGGHDDWVADAAARACKPGNSRCALREVRSLTLGGVPPPMAPIIGVPPPPPAAPSSPKAKASAAAAVVAMAAAAAAALSKVSLKAATGVGGGGAQAGQQPQQPPAPPPRFSDRGLVRLFGCARLRRLELRHQPCVTLAGVTALTRGAPALERVVCVACPGIAAATRDAIARAGVLGTRCVEVVSLAE